MASNVTSRTAPRLALASLLRTALVGSGLPVQAVYAYPRANSRGIWPVVLIESVSSGRSKLTEDTINQGFFDFDVHTFVLYAEKKQQATNSPAAGSNVVINVADTSRFSVGSKALIEDGSNEEIITVNAIVADASIRAVTLINSYVTPTAQSWTESDSEDCIDTIEKIISDTLSDNFVTMPTAKWLEINGQTSADVLVMAGREYRHEKIPVRVHVLDN